jgi:signal transduction histidine kinase
MRPSLKRKLYLHIILLTGTIILFNRFAAQWFLFDQLVEQTQQDLGKAMVQCESFLDQPIEFRHCAFEHNRDRLTSVVAHRYLVCPAGTQDDTCLRLQGLQSPLAWRAASPQGGAHLIRLDTADGFWLGGRLNADAKSDGALVWVPESAVVWMRERLWELRDRNLIYVLPFILAMLGFLALWMAILILRPIRLLESSMSSLTSSNLGQSINLQAPYVEFERIVSTFEDLRVRLRDSFAKARRFAADASHELRTPLTILRGNVEQLINQLPVGSDTQVRMRMIGDEVERLIDITEKLLLLSRADGNSMVKDDSEFAISDFLHELAADAQAFHPELETRSQVEPDKVWVCDQRLIQQLIYNLYSNALKYNVADGWIRIGLHQQSDQLVLEFENPCDDIPADLPQLAFDRFYRGNAAHSRKIDGLGLGLSLCQEIARLHDASLTLSATPAGTVLVKLVIPLTTACIE